MSKKFHFNLWSELLSEKKDKIFRPDMHFTKKKKVKKERKPKVFRSYGSGGHKGLSKKQSCIFNQLTDMD